MNLYARVRHNPVSASTSELADEVVTVGKQILTMLSSPVPTDSSAGLMFYAAVRHEAKKKVLALVLHAQQLQEQKTKPSLAGEGLENKGA